MLTDKQNKEKINEGLNLLGDGVKHLFESNIDVFKFSEIDMLVCKAIRIAVEEREKP